MYALVRELYPICRSITGDGVRQTLEILGRHVPLSLTELPTGADVLDWTVPKEWNIKGGWIQKLNGERVLDFASSNLHVLNYSTPVPRRRISRAELEPHLHSLPEHPDWVPYRTSYYAERWGFCLSQRQREALTDAEYEICIDSTLEPGHLTYAESVIPGASTDEIVLTAHICHPSLCNDNLSGISVATFLLQELQKQPQRYTLRVLFIPGTIGSIAWLSQNRERAASIKHGLSLVCLGDDSPFTYKRTLHGSREVDRVLAYALEASKLPSQVIDYFPYGYDERQFNSPGFGLPVGSLMRGQHGKFPEYHTSADNLELRVSRAAGGVARAVPQRRRHVERQSALPEFEAVWRAAARQARRVSGARWHGHRRYAAGAVLGAGAQRRAERSAADRPALEPTLRGDPRCGVDPGAAGALGGGRCRRRTEVTVN